MGSLFKKGYSAVREEKQKQDENREKAGKQLWRFFLQKDGDEAEIRFLTEEPINFYEHTVATMRGGKQKFDSVICTKNLLGNCDLCDDDDKPTFKGAYLIYDKRPYEYTDKNGKAQKLAGQVRLYIQGARVLSQLDRLSERYGLTNRDYLITRSGSGTSTTYMFDRGEQSHKLSESEIKNMLPEKLRDSYSGTMESLYDIVEDQLRMLVKDKDEEEDDIPEMPEKNLVGVEDDEPEEVVEKKPVKTGMFKKKNPQENSVKPLFKKK